MRKRPRSQSIVRLDGGEALDGLAREEADVAELQLDVGPTNAVDEYVAEGWRSYQTAVL